MININSSQFYAHWAGLFTVEQEWIHPARTEKTYEIIYVLEGAVSIHEDGHDYALGRHDLLLLDANKLHYGYKTSNGTTSFFWAHFYIDEIKALPPLCKHIKGFSSGYLFKEHVNLYCTPGHISEALDISMLGLISKIMQKETENDELACTKLAADIYEWLKINFHPSLSADTIARNFGYSKRQISRILKQRYGGTVAKINDDFIIHKANNMLMNTNDSIKEISSELGFLSDNLFTKFYIYHTGISPTYYRRSNANIRLNKG